jgi:hypothetical protein
MSEERDDMRRPMTSIAAAASTLCIGLSAAAETASDKPPETGIDVQVPDSKERIEEYWTRDRMRAAKPMPKPVISRETGAPVTPDEDATESE